MGVWDIYYVLFKHKWRIVALTLTIIVGLVLFSFCWPAKFRVASRFLLEKTTSTLSDAAIFPQHTTSLLRSVTGVEEANNETQIVLSRPVLEKVARDLGLAEPYPDPNPGGILGTIQWSIRRGIKIVTNLPRIVLEGLGIIQPATPEKKFEKSISALKDRIIVQHIADSDVLQIGMEGWFPQHIAREVQAVSNEYLRQHVNVHQGQGAVRFFDDHLEDARKSLQNVEQEQADYRVDNHLISMDKAETTLLEKIEILERERISLEKEILSLQTKLVRIKASLADPTQPVIPSPEINSLDSVVRLQDQLLEHRLALEGLLERYTPENPRVQAARSEGERIKALLRSEVERVVGLEEAQLANWRAEEGALTVSLARLYEQGQSLPQQRLRMEQFDRSIREASGLYQAILKKQADSQMTLSQDSRMVKATLLEPAVQPVSPVWPDLFLNLLVGVPLAPVVSIALAFLIESLRNTFKREEDVTTLLGVPTLAVLEHDRSPREARAKASEPIRRAAAILAERAAREPQRVLVTSAVSGEGSSGVANLLAETLGATRKVLLVDGHSSSKLARATGDAGGRLGAADQSSRGVVHVAAPGTDVMYTRDDLAAWLGSEGRGFDLVLIDAPPALESSATHPLAGACNGAILVVAAEQTGHSLAERARQRIREAGCEVIGAVLTGYRRWIPRSLEQRL